MGASEVEAFLTHLATERHVAPSTHKQALAALLFLYRQVLDIDLPWMQQIGRPKSPIRIPVVLSRAEIARLLECVDPTFTPMVGLLYGAGLRLMECLRLRVKDIDFDRKILVVREGKGRKDRVVMLPEPLIAALRRQLERSRTLWAEDRARRIPGVSMPDALARKHPRASASWAWHWVFPSPALSANRALAFVGDIISTSRRSVARLLVP